MAALFFAALEKQRELSAKLRKTPWQTLGKASRFERFRLA
jgi:hypothetical protein